MNDELLAIMPFAAAVIGGLMGITWLVSIIRRDVSIVDIVWGMGFALVAMAVYWKAGPDNGMALLPVALTVVWAGRLSIHLAIRNWGSPEDFRYAAMREKWGRLFPIVSLFTVFGLQGLIMWIVSLPLQAGIVQTRQPILLLLVAGIGLWLVGVFFETVGDWQLARFKSDPQNKGQVLKTGLWQYTRHPNYFGDFLVWWGLFLVAVSLSGAWWTMISPLLMSVLLMKVSGVSLLEKTLKKSKSGYADYVRSTNAFFPWWPRVTEE